MLAGLTAFVRPVTGQVISAGLINWGTALGAACFSAAGVAQLFERPAVARPIIRQAGTGTTPQPMPGDDAATGGRPAR